MGCCASSTKPAPPPADPPGARDLVPAMVPTAEGSERPLNEPDRALPPPNFDKAAVSAALTPINAFSEIDTDDDGFVTPDELKAVLVGKCGLSESQVDDIYASADKNEDGTLSMLEFAKGVRQSAYAAPALEEGKPALRLTAVDAFAAADADGSGTLTKEELTNAMKAKTDMSEAEIEAFFAECDVNEDGMLTMIEAAKGFKKVMKAGKLGSLASSG